MKAARGHAHVRRCEDCATSFEPGAPRDFRIYRRSPRNGTRQRRSSCSLCFRLSQATSSGFPGNGMLPARNAVLDQEVAATSLAASGGDKKIMAAATLFSLFPKSEDLLELMPEDL